MRKYSTGKKNGISKNDHHDPSASGVPMRRNSAPKYIGCRTHEYMPVSMTFCPSSTRTFAAACRDEVLRRVLMDVANELRDKGALDEAECFIDVTGSEGHHYLSLCRIHCSDRFTSTRCSLWMVSGALVCVDYWGRARSNFVLYLFPCLKSKHARCRQCAR